jgi:glycosyltransferase involved in cell wall biosynthesis
MYGIVNALTRLGREVVLISNAVHRENFHPSVRHLPINLCVSKKEKRLFQFFLALFPNAVVRLLFRKYLKRFAFLKTAVRARPIICFEHLDNSLGSFFKENGLIADFIHDTHGIAPLEFRYKDAASISERLVNRIKYLLSLRLEKKVMGNASGFLFVSNAMHHYFSGRYGFLAERDVHVLRDGVNPMLCEQRVDAEALQRLQERFKIAPGDRVIFFAGNFKDLGGVTDLIEAFALLESSGDSQPLKLLLVGDGERYDAAKSLVRRYGLEHSVVFAGRIPYTLLRTYQELASVIVCPDKQHPFSQLVPHIKYFDALVSGKVVINGAFDAVKEINRHERFSLNFEPSNIKDLAGKITYALMHLDALLEKSGKHQASVCSHFSYDHFVKVLVDDRK